MNLKTKLVKVWILTEMIFFLTFIPCSAAQSQEMWMWGGSRVLGLREAHAFKLFITKMRHKKCCWTWRGSQKIFPIFREWQSAPPLLPAQIGHYFMEDFPLLFHNINHKRVESEKCFIRDLPPGETVSYREEKDEDFNFTKTNECLNEPTLACLLTSLYTDCTLTYPYPHPLRTLSNDNDNDNKDWRNFPITDW